METKNTETRNPTFGFALLVFALVLVVAVSYTHLTLPTICSV